MKEILRTQLLRLLLIIVVFGLVSSCSEQENVKDLVVETNKSKAVLYMDAGKMHNDILERYELEELKTGALYSRRNVSDLKNMIQVIDVYLKSIGSDVLFSDVLKEDIILQSNILQLIGAGNNLKSLQQVLLATDAGEMTKIFTEYSSSIIQLFENHKDFTTIQILLDKMRIVVLEDLRISEIDKKNLLASIAIGEKSVDFWCAEKSDGVFNLTGLQFRFIRIAGADTAGALTMIQSGAVAAGTVFGGWGGLVVLVGGAAVGSLMAAHVLAFEPEKPDLRCYYLENYEWEFLNR